MRLFLDTSVLLAACERVAGASHAIFDLAVSQGWQLLTCDFPCWQQQQSIMNEDTLSPPAVSPGRLIEPCRTGDNTPYLRLNRVQPKLRVHRTRRLLDLRLRHRHRHLDLTRRNHLDVDPLLRQRPKHPCRYP